MAPPTFFLILMLSVSGCGSAPERGHGSVSTSGAPEEGDESPAENDAPEERSGPTARFEVMLAEGTPDATITVSLEMPVDWVEPVPASVTLHFQPVELSDPSAPEGFFLADGARQTSGGPLELEVKDGVLRAEYQVLLSHHRYDPLRGVDNVPHPTSGGWTVPGSAFIPIAMHIPDGRELDLGATLELGGGGHLMGTSPEAPSFKNFANTLHLIGDYDVQHLGSGEATIRLASADFSKEELGPLVTLIERTLELGTEWLGPLPDADLLIAVDRIGETYEGGLVGRDNIVLSGPDLGEMSGTEMPGLIVVHELGHLWNRADEMWLNEGFTRLFEVSVGAELDGLDAAARTRRWAERIRRYEVLAGIGRTVRGDAFGAWPYEGGLAVLICLEADLRDAGSGLAALHGMVRSADGSPIQVTEWIATANELAPGSGDWLLTRLDEPGPIEVGPCLERLGFAVETGQLSVPDARGLVVETLQITSLDTRPLVVKEVLDGSPFRPGDRIVSVAGVGVHDVGSMQAAMAGTDAGDTIRIQWVRNGEQESVEVAAPSSGDGMVLKTVESLAPGDSEGRVLGH